MLDAGSEALTETNAPVAKKPTQTVRIDCGEDR